MLKPTKHATTNFKMLVPFLDEVDRCGGSITMTREGLMPLSIEDLGYTFEGRKVYGMMHFYTQAGDMMRDPDMGNGRGGLLEVLLRAWVYLGGRCRSWNCPALRRT